MENLSFKNMLVISSDWNESTTFRMIAISQDCPYNEVIYDVDQKQLAIICKDSKDKPTMLPKLDNTGRPKILTGKNQEGASVQFQAAERIVMNTYYEYYISDANDIRTFVNLFAINPEHKAINVLNNLEPEVDTSSKKKDKSTSEKAK